MVTNSDDSYLCRSKSCSSMLFFGVRGFEEELSSWTLLAVAEIVASWFWLSSCWVFFLFFFTLKLVRGFFSIGFGFVFPGPKVVEGEETWPFWIFVGLALWFGLFLRFGCWITGAPFRLENTFNLMIKCARRVRYKCYLINLRVQSPHVRINLNISKGRLKTIWWLWELELGGIHHGFSHEVFHIRWDELPGKREGGGPSMKFDNYQNWAMGFTSWM